MKKRHRMSLILVALIFMSNVNVFGSENIDINNESQMSNIVNQEELHGTPDKQNTKKFTNQVSLKNGDSIVVSALV